MKNTTKMLSLLIAVVMLLGMTFGCTAAPAAPTGETTGAAPAQEAATAPAEKGRILTVASMDEITDFNPFTNQQTTYLCLINNNCLETLLYMDADMAYTPGLATEWTVTDDGLNYSFKLREGIKFHDGSDFTAEDVKYAIEYTVNPDNGCWRSNYFTAISAIDCPDDYTVNLTLSSPTPALLDSFSTLAIVPSEQDPATYVNTVIGTGPFKFVSYTPNDCIIFEKNDAYWDAANVKLGGITIKFVADQATALTNLEAGDIDLIYALDASYAEQVEATAGMKVVTSPTSNTTHLFEIGKHNFEPFCDENVLKAMFMCLDTQTIADEVFYGYANPSKGIVHSGAKYYKDVYQNDYDVEAAKALLATTPYADGFEFSLFTLPGVYENIGIIWQQDLAKIGIKMNVEVQEMTVWLENYLGRTYQMIANSYSMVGTDPATLMTLIVSSLYPYQAAPEIIPGLQELIDAGAATASDAEREKIYAELFELLDKSMPIYTYLSVDNLYACADNLMDVVFNGEARYVFTHAYFA